MSKFTVELGVLKRHLTDAEQCLLVECEVDGVSEHPEFLHLRRLVRELHRTIDALQTDATKKAET
jgi:hypothetical protein